jgi:regulator of protease activity HflC (stomatin/prohibitin superfamily)
MNAMICVNDLEAKFKAITKALEESKIRLAPAEAKHTEEIATANCTATQAVKKAKAQAAKAEKSLAKVVQGQSQCEAAAIERLNALSTSFSSNIFLPCDSGCHFLFKCV